MTGRGKVYVPLAIVSLVFVAFLLRLHLLDEQSFWWDEVLTAVIVREPFLAMLDKAALYLHPPFYYIVLHWWRQIAGASDWATRFPSVVFGTALIPLIFVAGKRLSGNSLGLLAAIIAALSPFLVHYSQEARDYSLAVTLCLASIYFLIAAVESDKPKDWSIWGAVSIVTAYTEYLFLPVFAAEVMAIAALLVLRRRRHAISGLAAIFAVPVSLIPWLFYSRSVSGAAGEIARGTDLVTLVRDTASAFFLGTAAKVDDAVVPALCVVAVAIAGAVFHRHRSKAALFVVPTLALPLIALYLLSVGRRDYAVRYSLVAYPSYILLLAFGLDWFWSKAKLLGAVAMIAISVAALAGVDSYYNDYQYSRDDFRGAARSFDDQARPGDVIVFNAAWGKMAFDYYSSSGSPSVGIDTLIPNDENGLKRLLSDLASRYDRIWLAGWQDYFSDPKGKVRQWLDDNTTQMDFAPFRLIALTEYRTAPVVMRAMPTIQTPALTDFNNGVRFLGYDLDTSLAGAKGRLYVTLYWQAIGQVAKSFNVYVKLIDQGFHVWGQKDNRPVYDRLPTDIWQSGEIFRDEYVLEILPGTPPGSYQLAVGLYDPTNFAASTLVGNGADHLSLGPVNIPRIDKVPTITYQKKTGFGDSIQLLGYNMESDWKPGSGVHLTLFWQATGPIAKDYTVFNHLVDAKGQLVSQKDGQPTDGLYPTSKWQAGQIVRDQYDIVLPKNLPSGSHSLQVGLYDAATGERLPLRDNPKGNYLTIDNLAVRP